MSGAPGRTRGVHNARILPSLAREVAVGERPVGYAHWRYRPKLNRGETQNRNYRAGLPLVGGGWRVCSSLEAGQLCRSRIVSEVGRTSSATLAATGRCQASRNVTKWREMSRNFAKRYEISRNAAKRNVVAKRHETLQNVAKFPETSRNVAKRSNRQRRQAVKHDKPFCFRQKGGPGLSPDSPLGASGKYLKSATREWPKKLGQ